MDNFGNKFVNKIEIVVNIVEEKVYKSPKGLLKNFNFKFYLNETYKKFSYIKGVSFTPNIVNMKYDKNEKYIIIGHLGINIYDNKNKKREVWHKIFVKDIIPLNNRKTEIDEKEILFK